MDVDSAQATEDAALNVEMLRTFAAQAIASQTPSYGVALNAAADEIERLRAEVVSKDAEIRALRAENDEWQRRCQIVKEKWTDGERFE